MTHLELLAASAVMFLMGILSLHAGAWWRIRALDRLAEDHPIIRLALPFAPPELLVGKRTGASLFARLAVRALMALAALALWVGAALLLVGAFR